MIFNFELYNIPSFYSHVINGILLLLTLIILFKYYSSVKHIEKYKLINLVLLLSIAFGIHSISHLGLEKIYGYNPFK